MPTYDYECDACQHAWELFQKMTDEPVKKCPKCGKKKARRLFGTGAALMFKGSGFYETDYRSKSYKKSAEADKKSAESSSESKSESGKSDSGKSETGKSETGKSDSGKSETKKSETKSTKPDNGSKKKPD